MTALTDVSKLSTAEAVVEFLRWEGGGKGGPIVGASARELRMCARKVLDAWGELVSDPDALPSDMELEVEDVGGVVILRGEGLRHVCVLGCIVTLWDVISEAELHAMKLSPADAWFKQTTKKYSIGSEADASWLEKFTGVHWTFLAAYLGLPIMRHISDMEPYGSAVFENSVHNALGLLHKLRTEVGAEDGYLEDVGAIGLSAAIYALGRYYRGVAKAERRLWEERSGRQQWGPFGLIRPHQLAQLAAREESMVARYGDKGVERAFENQLALVIQSLGFVVVRARIAERRVDVLCIAGRSPNAFTFLVEAKTSRRPYAFPTKDERALGEYVGEVRAALETLPTLALVLLVGSTPGGGLHQKLRRFEAEHAIPIRFVPASALAALRIGLPGPVQAKDFREAVLAADVIADDSLADGLIRTQETRVNSHVQLVRSMLGSDLVTDDAPVRLPKSPGLARSRRPRR